MQTVEVEMAVEWREHKGVRVLVADYRDLRREDEQIGQLEETAEAVRRAPTGTALLADYRGIGVSPAYMRSVKQLNNELYGPRQTRIAVLGIEGLKGMLLKAFNRVGSGVKAVPFDAEQAALDWLVEDPARAS